ncbi:Vacuolar protein [Trichinella pseudospiralis]
MYVGNDTGNSLHFVEIAVWKFEMSELPKGYKSLKPFLKIAEIMSERDVAVEYWCLRYVYREAQNIDRTSPECTSFTSCLSSYFKKLEDENKVDQRFSSESVAHLYIERMVYNMFQMADEIDRSERFSIDITTSFIIASNLITVLSVFGDIDARLIEARKPLSAPQNVNKLLDQVRYHGLLSPGSCTYYHICGIGRKVEVPPHYSDIHDDGASADLVLEEALERFVDFNNVHEYCTLAVRSSESLYQCDEWTSKKGKREKKDKGYCYLHRLSSKEQLVHISVIFVIHFCSIGADIAALHLCSLSPQLVLDSTMGGTP